MPGENNFNGSTCQRWKLIWSGFFEVHAFAFTVLVCVQVLLPSCSGRLVCVPRLHSFCNIPWWWNARTYYAYTRTCLFWDGFTRACRQRRKESLLMYLKQLWYKATTDWVIRTFLSSSILMDLDRKATDWRLGSSGVAYLKLHCSFGWADL